MEIGAAIGALAVGIWLYLLIGRGGFWRADIREERETFAAPTVWPSITAVIPARDEADVIGRSLSSLLRQDYPGDFRVILVDDQSTDGTADAAMAAAGAAGVEHRLTVVTGQSLPRGWSGKLWAVKQGVDHATADAAPAPDYLLLTDADIAYDPGTVQRLASRAAAGRLVLTSLMVKLRCESVAERALIPAFVFFFQLLYPFSQVNRPGPVAAAAGGCMLIRRDALAQAGGIPSIRAALIDDCAMGRMMKSVGPVWLGLTDSVHSLRPYPAFGDIRRMVARSAYDQLGYSPLLLLLGTVLGMILTYLAPAALALFGDGPAQQMIGIAAWALMTLAFLPIVRFYRLSPLWALALPGIAAAYTAFTLDSAYQYYRGRGGMWKGRVQARQVSAQ